jgi:excisionase family DNA binding protein
MNQHVTAPTIEEPTDLPLVLTLQEAAKVLRIGDDLLRKLRHQHLIGSVRQGRRVVIPRIEIARYLAREMAA